LPVPGICLGNEDSVVKLIDFPSSGNLYQGATISGQGNVVLILDAERSRIEGAGMINHRIMAVMDASHRTRRTIEQSLREIDRRALNDMALVKRHGNTLAGYGVVVQAFREQAVESVPGSGTFTIRIPASSAGESEVRSVSQVVGRDPAVVPY
jgi:hypothetical protein